MVMQQVVEVVPGARSLRVGLLRPHDILPIGSLGTMRMVCDIWTRLDLEEQQFLDYD